MTAPMIMGMASMKIAGRRIHEQPDQMTGIVVRAHMIVAIMIVGRSEAGIVVSPQIGAPVMEIPPHMAAIVARRHMARGHIMMPPIMASAIVGTMVMPPGSSMMPPMMTVGSMMTMPAGAVSQGGRCHCEGTNHRKRDDELVHMNLPEEVSWNPESGPHFLNGSHTGPFI